MIRKIFFAVLFIACCFPVLSQQVNVKGTIFDKDSISPMAYAYVVNKNSSAGTVSDEAGKFTIKITLGDTLSFSYLGYSIKKIYTQTLKNSVQNAVLNVTVYLTPKSTELNSVMITSHAFSKETKEYYARRIDEYQRGTESPLANPISALYYTFSKKGKELQKLSVLYQQLIADETKEHRLSDEKVRIITGNDTLNVKAFWNYCYLPDQFIMNASDYDLFFAVHSCYNQYIEMLRRRK